MAELIDPDLDLARIVGRLSYQRSEEGGDIGSVLLSMLHEVPVDGRSGTSQVAKVAGDEAHGDRAGLIDRVTKGSPKAPETQHRVGMHHLW